MKETARSSAKNLAQLRSTFLFFSRICLLFLLALAPCGVPAEAQTVVVVGSGSSVPAPLYSRWAQEYSKRNP
ncbi:MAG: hypothetical protein WA899_07860, partial [Candidatus Sulfotelmatobacter sp.]